MPNYTDQVKFEIALKVGQPVEVRWTCGSLGHYVASGKVAKINTGSVRVAIDNDIPSQWNAGQLAYHAGKEIVVPLLKHFTRNSKWSPINCVRPIQEV